MKKFFLLLLTAGLAGAACFADDDKKAAAEEEKFKTVEYAPRADGTPVLNCSSEEAFGRSVMAVALALPDEDIIRYMLALRGFLDDGVTPADCANKTGLEIIKMAESGKNAKSYQEALDELNKLPAEQRAEMVASLRGQFEAELNPPAPAKLDWVVGFDEAAKLAAEQKKQIFALFTGSDWCPWCIKLNRELLSTAEFKAYAEKHYVLLLVDFPRKGDQSEAVKKANRELSEKYDVSGFPTVKILSADGKVLATSGYSRTSVGGYISSLEKAVSEAK
ncbi:MAG: thioredoxin family protein [Victivallaceae bacterium]|nr:thioredoxin family protein [Victivallaceae bacterium]